MSEDSQIEMVEEFQISRPKRADGKRRIGGEPVTQENVQPSGKQSVQNSEASSTTNLS